MSKSQVTQQDFDYIKELIAKGRSDRQVRELTGRSTGTIYYIKKSDSFESYLNRGALTKLELKTRKVGETTWDLDKLWTIYTKRFINHLGKDRISGQIGFYASSVENIISTFNVIFKLEQIDEVKVYLTKRGFPLVVAENFLEVWRRVKLTDHKVEPKTMNVIAQETSLDQAINELDTYYQGLQEKITAVVASLVSQKLVEEKKTMEEYKKEKETEITALRTVVEKAKSSNLADALKKALMGG